MVREYISDTKYKYKACRISHQYMIILSIIQGLQNWSSVLDDNSLKHAST